MMMSLRCARWCIRVMKQRSNCGHFWPVHRSLRASSLAQAELDSGSVLISARSPNSVVFSHSRMIWKSATSSRPVEHRLLFGVVDFLPAGVVGAAFHVADLRAGAGSAVGETECP